MTDRRTSGQPHFVIKVLLYGFVACLLVFMTAGIAWIRDNYSVGLALIALVTTLLAGILVTLLVRGRYPCY